MPAWVEPSIRNPETHVFPDGGAIPDSVLPLLVYRQVLRGNSPDLPGRIEQGLAAHDWSGSWRNGVYPFHHYHSTAHEVLVVFDGSATLQLGGDQGKKFEVHSGDAIIIPAGVGHKCLQSSSDFRVIGAYPDGREWDLLKGAPGERPRADQNIASVPWPAMDPLYGKEGPLLRIWAGIR